eukprot:EG_transcript_20739
MFGRNPFVRSSTPSPPKDRPRKEKPLSLTRAPSPEPLPLSLPPPLPLSLPPPRAPSPPVFNSPSLLGLDPFMPKESIIPPGKPLGEPEDNKQPGLNPRHNEKRGRDMLSLRAKLFKMLDMMNNGETPHKDFCIECGVLPNITIDGVHRAIKGAQTLIDTLGAEPPVPTAPTPAQLETKAKVAQLKQVQAEEKPTKKPKVAQYDWS